MPCYLCHRLLLRQSSTSTRLHRQSANLLGLAGCSRQAAFLAFLRACRASREDYIRAETDRRIHQLGPHCTPASSRPCDHTTRRPA